MRVRSVAASEWWPAAIGCLLLGACSSPAASGDAGVVIASVATVETGVETSVAASDPASSASAGADTDYTTDTSAAASTTTAPVDPRTLPGHHLGPIPPEELVMCTQAAGVPLVGEPLAVAEYESRPTVLQRADEPGAPLVVVFHGQNGCIQNVQSRSDLDAIGPAAGVHVLWLSGEPLPTRSWNVNGRCCEPASTHRVDDLDYVVAALAAASDAGLAPAVVIAAGVSNGAGMAVTAACRLPQMFTGVVVVAGWVGTTCHPAAQSLLVFGGTLDENLGARQAARAASVWRSQVVTCAADPAVEVAGPRTVSTWTGCTADTFVRLVQLEGVPHVWPKFDYYDIDDEIVLFALGRLAA